MSEPRAIPLSVPCIRGNARAYLDECLTTNFVSSVGPFVERFEREFAAYVGARHAVACSSGTAAIHVALRLLGIGPGDEVLVPTLTFIASANPILYEHATPILVDAEEQTWNLDPELVVEELARRARAGERMPKAVLAVHLLGHPARIAPLADACERHGVTLIEDAAEALGSRYTGGTHDGRHVGTIGRIGCFSFNGNKIITTGGGGMLTTDDAQLARRAKHLTTQARLPGPEYFHDEVGYNYRLTNLQAALGVAQLELLDEFVAAKRAIAARYDAALAALPGLSPPPRAAWAAPSLWLYTARLGAELGLDRKQLFARLAAARIDTRPIWTPLHLMPMYANARRLGGAVAERLFAACLSLPCSADLDERDQARVIAALAGAARG
ncbi:MAG TPA: LegC family aminotransferase [Polyangia bacterium]|nr:LegC family aminotransferase [Polyangia bacterium]